MVVRGPAVIRSAVTGPVRRLHRAGRRAVRSGYAGRDWAYEGDRPSRGDGRCAPEMGRTVRLWYITGAPSKGWNNDDLHTLGRLHGSDFEVVDTSALPRPR